MVEQKTAIAVLTGNKCTLNSAKILCITIILQGKKTLLQIPTTLLQQYYGCTTAIFRSTELQYLQVTTGHYRSLQVTTVTTGHYRFREKVTEFADERLHGKQNADMLSLRRKETDLTTKERGGY